MGSGDRGLPFSVAISAASKFYIVKLGARPIYNVITLYQSRDRWPLLQHSDVRCVEAHAVPLDAEMHLLSDFSSAPRLNYERVPFAIRTVLENNHDVSIGHID